jgi:hypothetical protein
LIGGGKQKKASRRAEAAQLEYLNRALDEQRRQFDTTQQNFEPYNNLGRASLGPLGDLIGVNGNDAQGSAIEALRSSPFYQSLYRTGEEALLANASATGGIRGGNTQRSLADFGADTLATTIDRQLANLGGLAGMGLGSTESLANFGANKANAVSNILGQQGQVRAGGLLTRGGITAQQFNNAGSFLDSLASSFLPSSGIGGALKSIF